MTAIREMGIRLDNDRENGLLCMVQIFDTFELRQFLNVNEIAHFELANVAINKLGDIIGQRSNSYRVSYILQCAILVFDTPGLPSCVNGNFQDHQFVVGHFPKVHVKKLVGNRVPLDLLYDRSAGFPVVALDLNQRRAVANLPQSDRQFPGINA